MSSAWSARGQMRSRKSTTFLNKITSCLKGTSLTRYAGLIPRHCPTGERRLRLLVMSPIPSKGLAGASACLFHLLMAMAMVALRDDPQARAKVKEALQAAGRSAASTEAKREDLPAALEAIPEGAEEDHYGDHKPRSIKVKRMDPSDGDSSCGSSDINSDDDLGVVEAVLEQKPPSPAARRQVFPVCFASFATPWLGAYSQAADVKEPALGICLFAPGTCAHHPRGMSFRALYLVAFAATVGPSAGAVR